MKFLIDSADVTRIRELWCTYPCDGVTTNPSILAKSGRPPFEVLSEIRALIGEDAELHVQVVSTAAEDMIREAERITSKLGKGTFIKIPTTPEGVRAMRLLSEQGYCITATAIYAPMQVYLAAKAGAKYVAPYVNRIDNLGYDGVATAQRMQSILENNGFETEILAASFKNVQQVLALCEYGVGACTVAPDVIDAFLKNENVDAAVSAFTRDFASLCGDGETMLTCK